MKYKNNLTLTNPRRVPFSLSNRFDDTFGLTDMVSDCKNAEDFCAAANKYDRFHLKWKIDKDSKNETRLTCKDTFGNIDYLIAYKEDSGLPEIPTGNMITELRSRGYSVSVDKPEKIISKKDLGKLFQEAADTDQDELDFYSQLVSAGIPVHHIPEYPYVLHIEYSWGDREPDQKFSTKEDAWKKAMSTAMTEADTASDEKEDGTAEIIIEKAKSEISLVYPKSAEENSFCRYYITKEKGE